MKLRNLENAIKLGEGKKISDIKNEKDGRTFIKFLDKGIKNEDSIFNDLSKKIMKYSLKYSSN